MTVTKPQRILVKQWHPILFILIFFGLGLHTAVSKSATIDEPVHLLRGGALWQTGDARLQYEHAPLAHWLIGSLLTLEPTLPRIATLPSWEMAEHIPLTEQFLHQTRVEQAERRVLLLARLPILFAGLLLGALLARWSKERDVSLMAEIVIMVLYAFSPNLLAHFSLATTDGMLTAVFAASIWAWEHFWKRPSIKRWLLAALFLGLALATKLTALILPPALLLLTYNSVTTSTKAHSYRYLIWAAMLPVAGIMIWMLYGFDVGLAGGTGVTLPAAAYFNSVLDLLAHSDKGHVAYLLGERSLTGWYIYFIVVILVKTPLITLLLLIIAAVSLTRHRAWRRVRYLWLPPIVLLLLASYGRLNIGYRHILPILPFIWLLIGETISYRQRWAQKTVLILFLLWYIAASWRQLPDYLPYFNEIVNGSAHGSDYLADSNLDWGQDLYALVDFAAEHGDEMAGYSYFGPVDEAKRLMGDSLVESPAFYAANPSAGVYAISSTHLQGVQLEDPDLFDWFRQQSPIESLGYSIQIYNVPASATGEWAAICEDPAAILSPTAVPALLGLDNLRIVTFNCRQSWPFPDGGTAGWYILPQQENWPIAVQLSSHLHRVYRHDPAGDIPSFEIYYWDGEIDPVPALVNGRHPLSFTLPVEMGATAVLHGYSVDDLRWQTIWQVQKETAAPLTIAAHLYADAPTPVGNSDGLGFNSAQWRTGDIFVQQFTFEQIGTYVETGIYDYVSGERMASVGKNGRTGQFVRLPSEQ